MSPDFCIFLHIEKHQNHELEMPVFFVISSHLLLFDYMGGCFFLFGGGCFCFPTKSPIYPGSYFTSLEH